MIGFDINGATSLDAIGSYMSSYGSPEAAQADTSNEAQDYLTKEYGRMTGDAFADPFEAAKSARDAALSTAISAGRTPALPGQPQAPQLSINSGNFATGPTVNLAATKALADRVANDNQRVTQSQTLQDSMLQATLSHKDYQLGDPNDASGFREQQRKRVNAVGGEATSIFDRLKQHNPDALKLTDSTDPSLQLDEKGKPVAGDVLNSNLYSDPEFQLLLKNNPKKAGDLYTALYDRNLDQDLNMQRGANDKRAKERDDVLAGLSKTLDFDPDTGEPFIRTYKSDPFNPGQEIEGRRPLSAIEKHFMDQEGGFKGRFGFDPTAGLDYKNPDGSGMAQAETQALRAKVKELRSSFPNEPTETLILRARKALAPPSLLRPPSGPSDSNAAWTFRGKDFIGPIINPAISALNKLDEYSGGPPNPIDLIRGAPLTKEEGDAAIAARGPNSGYGPSGRKLDMSNFKPYSLSGM